jgi:hypothetical protein
MLVDERLLDSNPMMQHFQNKQDQSWKQPTEDSVKTPIGKKLKATLDNPDVPDDVKPKGTITISIDFYKPRVNCSR